MSNQNNGHLGIQHMYTTLLLNISEVPNSFIFISHVKKESEYMIFNLDFYLAGIQNGDSEISHSSPLWHKKMIYPWIKL